MLVRHLTLPTICLSLGIALSYQNCSPAKFASQSSDAIGSVGVLGDDVPPPIGDTGSQCTNSGCEQQKQISSMGLVADHMKCALCHLNVYGDIAATSTKPFEMRSDSIGVIFGSVFSNMPVNNSTTKDPAHQLVANSAGGVTLDAQNPQNKIVVQPTDQPVTLPQFKTDSIIAGVMAQHGFVSQNSQNIIAQIYQGNLLIDGTTSPFFIKGEVYVKGDLIIRGKYTGIGTIYVEGNIYIPGDVVADDVGPVFEKFKSLNQNHTAQASAAGDAIKNNVSALRLATARSVFIGNPGKTTISPNEPLPPDTRLTNYFNSRYTSYYTGATIQGYKYNTSQPFSRMGFSDSYMVMQSSPTDGIGFDTSERLKVFIWYPNYLSLLKSEFEFGTSAATSVCGLKQFRVEIGSVARVDSALYAQNGIAGFIGAGGNIVINGGIVTHNFGFLPATGWVTNEGVGSNLISQTIWETYKVCPNSSIWQLPGTVVNPFNNLPISVSEIRYDYRLGQQGAGFDIMRSEGY